jgi:cyclic lactone autoinducer peptide
MIRTVKTNLGNMIKKVAICKVNANCIGFMYEPRKPKNLEKVNTQRKENE